MKNSTWLEDRIGFFLWISFTGWLIALYTGYLPSAEKSARSQYVAGLHDIRTQIIARFVKGQSDENLNESFAAISSTEWWKVLEKRAANATPTTEKDLRYCYDVGHRARVALDDYYRFKAGLEDSRYTEEDWRGVLSSLDRNSPTWWDLTKQSPAFIFAWMLSLAALTFFAVGEAYDRSNRPPKSSSTP